MSSEAAPRSPETAQEILCVISRLLVGLAKGVVLGKVTVLAVIGRDRYSHGSRHETVGFVGALAVVDAKDNLAGAQELRSLFLRNPLAEWRVDAGDEHQITIRQPCGPQGQLKRRESFFMNPNAFSEETLFRDHRGWSIA